MVDINPVPNDIPQDFTEQQKFFIRELLEIIKGLRDSNIELEERITTLE